jgi:hypothetical protein
MLSRTLFDVNPPADAPFEASQMKKESVVLCRALCIHGCPLDQTRAMSTVTLTEYTLGVAGVWTGANSGNVAIELPFMLAATGLGLPAPNRPLLIESTELHVVDTATDPKRTRSAPETSGPLWARFLRSPKVRMRVDRPYHRHCHG